MTYYYSCRSASNSVKHKALLIYKKCTRTRGKSRLCAAHTHMTSVGRFFVPFMRQTRSWRLFNLQRNPFARGKMSLRYSEDEFIPKSALRGTARGAVSLCFRFASHKCQAVRGGRTTEGDARCLPVFSAMTFKRIPFSYFNLAISVVCRQH